MFFFSIYLCYCGLACTTQHLKWEMQFFLFRWCIIIVVSSENLPARENFIEVKSATTCLLANISQNSAEVFVCYTSSNSNISKFYIFNISNGLSHSVLRTIVYVWMEKCQKILQFNNSNKLHRFYCLKSFWCALKK